MRARRAAAGKLALRILATDGLFHGGVRALDEFAVAVTAGRRICRGCNDRHGGESKNELAHELLLSRGDFCR